MPGADKRHLALRLLEDEETLPSDSADASKMRDGAGDTVVDTNCGFVTELCSCFIDTEVVMGAHVPDRKSS